MITLRHRLLTKKLDENAKLAKSDGFNKFEIQSDVREMILRSKFDTLMKMESFKNVNEAFGGTMTAAEIFDFLSSIETEDKNMKKMIKDMLVSYYIHSDPAADNIKSFLTKELGIASVLVTDLENLMRRKGISAEFYELIQKLIVFSDNGGIKEDKRPKYPLIGSNGMTKGYVDKLLAKVESVVGKSDNTKMIFETIAAMSGKDSKGLGVGRFEVVLMLFFSGGQSPTKGDIELDGTSIEIKVGDARIGNNLTSHKSIMDNFIKMKLPSSLSEFNTVKELLADYIGSNDKSKINNSLNFIGAKMVSFANYLENQKIDKKDFLEFYVENFVQKIYGGKNSELIKLFVDNYTTKGINEIIIPTLVAKALIFYRTEEGFQEFLHVSLDGKNALTISNFGPSKVTGYIKTFITSGVIQGTTYSSNPTSVRMELR